MKFVHFSLLTLSLALSHAAWAQTEVRLADSETTAKQSNIGFFITRISGGF